MLCLFFVVLQLYEEKFVLVNCIPYFIQCSILQIKYKLNVSHYLQFARTRKGNKSN